MCGSEPEHSTVAHRNRSERGGHAFAPDDGCRTMGLSMNEGA
jgi:hypothetical protein